MNELLFRTFDPDPEQLSKLWDEGQHPRVPAGSPEGGQFTSDGGGGETEKPEPGGRAPAAIPHPAGERFGVAGEGATPQPYDRGGPGGAEGRGDVTAVWTPKSGTGPTFHERTDAAAFHAAILEAKQASRFGASVHAYEPEEYAKMRLFLTPDGNAGFALKGDDIISAFKNPDAKIDNFAQAALGLAVQEGGRRLDAFDTVLPALYSNAGFRAVARLKWDDTQAPAGWSKEVFGGFNKGEPDVVFMVYDPDRAGYRGGDGSYVEAYNDGILAQKRELAAIEFEREAKNIRLVNEDPLPKYLDKFEKQLNDRQTELEKAGQLGSEESDELQKMDGAISAWRRQESLKSPLREYGLNVVYDGDQKLLSAILSTYNPKTHVASLEFSGSVDNPAKLKNLSMILSRYHGRAERIEVNEWKDNADSIKTYEQAGFKLVGEGSFGLQRLVWGKTGPTPAELEAQERETEAHANRILGAAKATAIMLGYNPEMVSIVKGDRPFEVAGKNFMTAGMAYSKTGKIEMFADKIWNEHGAVSIAAHEVGHQKWNKVMAALEAERSKLVQDSTKLREETGQGILDEVGKIKPEYADKYPIAARFQKANENYDKRVKADGVSPYSTAYWDAVKKERLSSTATAETETIAEITRLEVEQHDLKGVPLVWRSYYHDINNSYDDVMAAEKAKK